MHHDRKHRRTFSWPPLLPRESLTHPHQPPQDHLPDINEDPFAHFITLAEDEDPLAMSAGILPSEQHGFHSNSTRLRTSLARRWARYVAGNHGSLHEIYHRPKQDAGAEKSAAGTENAAVSKADSAVVVPSIAIIAAPEPTLGHAQAVVARAREATRRSGRRGSRIHVQNRHSWQEPSMDLFTVDEEDEGADGRVEAVQDVFDTRPDITERARL